MPDVVHHAQLLKKHPRASLYVNFKDRSSPLIQAAGESLVAGSWGLDWVVAVATMKPQVSHIASAARGHYELLQAVLEAAVLVDGIDKAKRLCIDHRNAKKQTALMVACKHGCVFCL